MSSEIASWFDMVNILLALKLGQGINALPYFNSNTSAFI
ncbi:hypothetical protein PH505_ao00520 [Pseudoalteromonas distincta]|nr:hypothetical protein PH505_ao00520 [Pseudoalteromonas distincta]